MALHDNEMRAVYAATLNELIAADPNVVCLEADLSKASGTNPKVSHAHPGNFVDVGVSEANMIGVAAGLASEGKIPFCASFTCFASRRVYDQITISVAYANNNVKIIGTAPGVTAGPNGGTHMCFQDLAIMRAMPNMHVYSPCDVYELLAMMKDMVARRQPTYMQLIRPKTGKVFDESCKFEPGKAVRLNAGDDVTIVSTGYTTKLALSAAAALKEKGRSADVLHCPSVKPFDEAALVESAKRTRCVVAVENQNIIGGLGSACAETLGEKCPVRMKRLGVPDQFGEVATDDYLFEKHGFGVKHIVEACMTLILGE
ncbi:MAG TPA: transketolase C-terminal domain-containing protein [Candidatus Brocadiia bacterium]|nr:transketolase C-terminal domain-containing protein [Candidatus Brocadiia bacterium]